MIDQAFLTRNTQGTSSGKINDFRWINVWARMKKRAPQRAYIWKNK